MTFTATHTCWVVAHKFSGGMKPEKGMNATLAEYAASMVDDNYWIKKLAFLMMEAFHGRDYTVSKQRYHFASKRQ